MSARPALAGLDHAGDAAGARGGAVVVRLFLHAARRLLRAAAAARPDGHRRRRQEPAVAVHRHLRDAAGRAAALRRAGGKIAARALHPHRLSLLRRQPRRVLAAADARHRDRDRRARLFRLGQRVQSVRGRRVLVVHGRPVRRRAGQAAVRLHRRRRHGRRTARPGDHDLAVGAARPDQSADRGGGIPRSRGVLRLPAGARGDARKRVRRPPPERIGGGALPRCPS